MRDSNAASPPGRVIVAIPVRDEEARIADCLASLADQADTLPDGIVLLVNNTSDRTVAVACGTPLPDGVMLHIRNVTLSTRRANAGHARRLAMDVAAELAGQDGIILTTDADARVDREWVSANLACLRQGIDAVAGWVDLDPVEAAQIPAALHEADARECAYDALCDEIHARLDPDRFDPWPRHTQASGASIGVKVSAYRAVGGVPNVASGEDRALLAALRCQDAAIRHDLACHVTVSGRTVGRAPGGMADTIRRRMIAPDRYVDSRLEAASACARRAAARRGMRENWGRRSGLAALCATLGLPGSHYGRVLEAATFGAAWLALESASHVLRKRRLPVAELGAQTDEALAIVSALRQETDEHALWEDHAVAA